MRVIRAADCRRMPWKNGGGWTTEIAVWPEGAGLDAFVWRLSAARVEADGPFSLFPGIDRTLAVTEGAGVILTIGGRPPVDLDLETAPFRFPADQSTVARLCNGPITDLNVMTRRGQADHRVERVFLGQGARRDVADGALAFCAAGAVRVDGDVLLGAGDCLVGEDRDGCRICGSAPASTVFVVDIR
jgi:uncharacterized protein